MSPSRGSVQELPPATNHMRPVVLNWTSGDFSATVALL
jgi:hypothetical protein